MHSNATNDALENSPPEPWYKYGVMFLFFEMAVAIAVCGYSLYLTFHGLGSVLVRH